MKNLLLVCLFSLFTTIALSQNSDIRGFVYEEKNGEPVIFTPVYLLRTAYGAQTDVNGYFNISKVPAGNYTLVCQSLGFDTLRLEITVKANELITKKLFLKQATVSLREVAVSAEKQDKQTQVRMSVTKITTKEMKQLPSIGGEPDLAQYLQVLPGVVFTGDQGGQLYIRGGTPIQNKTLMDGMIIYNPFHSVGFYSVFDADLIRNADVYTGGFAANHGGRVSSIMDITMRDGNKKRFSGKTGVNTFGAKLVLEGPIRKQTDDPNKGSSSFLISAKQSYMNYTSKKMYTFLDDLDSTYVDSIGLPFKFRDIYAKLSFSGANGSKFNVFGFNFSDAVRYKSISNLNWNSYGAGTNFVAVPGGSKVLIKGNIAYSKYLINFIETSAPARSSGIDGFNMGLNFTYFLGKNDLDYGIELLGFSTRFDFTNALGRRITQNENTTEAATYVKYKITAKKVLIEPSVRLHYYASLQTASPEPRLGLKYNITDKFRFKASGGLYSQNLISSSSDRDVVNLFYGFLSGPDKLPDYKYKYDRDSLTYTNPANRDSVEITHSLQKAIHYIAGFEYDLTRYLDLNIEGYLKQFTQLANVNRNKLFEDNAENLSKPDYQKKDFIVETGYASGIDVLLKYEYKQFYLWLGYSLSWTKRFDGQLLYYPVFDRRHNANVVTSYKFGKNLDWETNLRWNLGSGFPFTKTQGFYEQLNFADGPNTNYTGTNGTLGIQYASLGSGRLPYYHRLDFSIKKNFYFGENAILDINLSVTNAYNRHNIFYFDRIRYQRVNQLPLLPSLGVNMTF